MQGDETTAVSADSGEATQNTGTDGGTSTGTETTETGPKTYPESYVQELRKESAGYRTKAKDYDDAFAGYDDNSRTELLTIAKQLADPATQPAVAKRLQAIAENILKGHQDGTPTTPTGEEDPDQKPMTRAEWKAAQSEADESRKHESAIKALEDESRALGVEPGTLEYAELLYLAQDPDVSGDLKKAHEKLEAHYVAKASARAEAHGEKAARWPGAPGTAAGTGAADAEGGSPKTFKDSRAGALAFLRGKAGS